MKYQTPLTLIAAISMLAIATPAYADPDSETMEETQDTYSDTTETMETDSETTYNDDGYIYETPEKDPLLGDDAAPLPSVDPETEWDTPAAETACPDGTIEQEDGSCMVGQQYEN